jgi:ring-1,2-phenylacetyl-CoA epoxidase subunit PaaC
MLVEQPNGDYGDTLVRQLYFDVWHTLWLKSLLNSSDAHIAQIAEKSLKEVSYHLRRSSDLVVRLGDGSDESHTRMQRSVNDLWMYSGEFFIDDALDKVIADRQIAPLPSSLKEEWFTTIQGIFSKATLTIPSKDAWMQQGGKQGCHTEHLGYLLAEMQFLQRAYPGAAW